MAKKTQKELEKGIKKYHLKRKPLTMRQIRLAFNDAGILGDVDTAIAALSDSDRSVAEIEWSYGERVYRYDDWFVKMTKQMGVTPSKMDMIFYKGYNL